MSRISWVSWLSIWVCFKIVWPLFGLPNSKNCGFFYTKNEPFFSTWDTPICWKHPSISPWNPKNTEKKSRKKREASSNFNDQSTYPHVRYPHEKQSLKGLLTIVVPLIRPSFQVLFLMGVPANTGPRLTGHETPQTCRQRPASVAGARLRPAQTGKARLGASSMWIGPPNSTKDGHPSGW